MRGIAITANLWAALCSQRWTSTPWHHIVPPSPPAWSSRTLGITSAVPVSIALAAPPTKSVDGNRLAYLDELNPWYPHRDFPRLTTPQWVGEDGVEAVVILS